MRLALMLLPVLAMGCVGNPAGYDVLDLYADTGACLHEVSVNAFGSATHTRGDSVAHTKHRSEPTKSYDKGQSGGGGFELAFDLTGKSCE